MKLFRKNEVTFAVVLIAIYVVGSSLMQRVSESVGVKFLGEMIFDMALSLGLIVFIRRGGLSEYLGLKRPEVSGAKMLFYIPLVLLGGAAAFFGLGMEYGLLSSVLRTVMMVCVGFLEEVIFRGFLFRGIARESLKRAVIISAVTFGIGHFVNLLNGSDIFENSIQVVYAVAVGFLLVFVFLRTGSIIPCILFHGFNNSLTAFTTGSVLINALGERVAVIVMFCIQLAIAGAYLFYVSKLPKRELPAL